MIFVKNYNNFYHGNYFADPERVCNGSSSPREPRSWLIGPRDPKLWAQYVYCVELDKRPIQRRVGLIGPGSNLLGELFVFFFG